MTGVEASGVTSTVSVPRFEIEVGELFAAV